MSREEGRTRTERQQSEPGCFGSLAAVPNSGPAAKPQDKERKSTYSEEGEEERGERITISKSFVWFGKRGFSGPREGELAHKFSYQQTIPDTTVLYRGR